MVDADTERQEKYRYDLRLVLLGVIFGIAGNAIFDAVRSLYATLLPKVPIAFLDLEAGILAIFIFFLIWVRLFRVPTKRK
jgi:hypothetical protein